METLAHFFIRKSVCSVLTAKLSSPHAVTHAPEDSYGEEGGLLALVRNPHQQLQKERQVHQERGHHDNGTTQILHDNSREYGRERDRDPNTHGHEVDPSNSLVTGHVCLRFKEKIKNVIVCRFFKP